MLALCLCAGKSTEQYEYASPEAASAAGATQMPSARYERSNEYEYASATVAPTHDYEYANTSNTGLIGCPSSHLRSVHLYLPVVASPVNTRAADDLFKEN